MSVDIILKDIEWDGVNKIRVPLEGGGTQDFSIGGGTPTLQTKTVTYTPTTSQQTDTISPDSGYDGLSLVNVIVNAMQGGADVPTFTLSGVQDGSTVTCDKTYAEVRALYDDGLLVALADAPTYNCVYAMSICDEPESSSLRYAVYDANGYPMGDVLITSSAMTYSVPSVTQKTMNLPTATKGTVTNHTMTIGVGVTAPRGFYGGGVTRGNPIYVSASELVSGSQTVSGNGTYDVTDLAELIVDTPTMTLPSTTSSTPTGTWKANFLPSTSQRYLNIPAGLNETAQYYQLIGMDLAPLNVTQNGTYNASDADVTGFNTVTVNVPSSSPTLQTKTRTYTPNSSTQTDSITFDSGYDGLDTVNITINPVDPKLVTGTFTTGSTAGHTEITLPYTGNGYPIMAVVVIDGGAYVSGTDWYTSAQRYAVGQWTMTKSNMSLTPSYTTSGALNQGVTTWIYKNTSSTSYARSSAMTSNVFSSSNASNTGPLCVRFKSNTTLSYYVNTSSYGLHPNMTYRYFIVYS